MNRELIPYFIVAVPLLPLVAAVINAILFGWASRTGSQRVQYWTILVSISAVLAALGAHFAVLSVHPPLTGEGTATIVSPLRWLTMTYPLTFSWAIRFDALTSIMVPVVLFVGLMVQIFSVGYLYDRKYDIARYFALLSFFMFSMLLLVVAANLFVFFVGWEAVGLSSYKLISFYIDKDVAQRAGKKAFIMNRIGDAALLLGAFAIFRAANTGDFREIALAFTKGSVAAGYANFIGLMIFIGAAAKSAQFPLYTWLPDAMTGPTPVSALIHAATMVTAGIFLMLRLEPVFVVAPEASQIVSTTGAITALGAAFVAAGQTDIKKILAFSTVSQLGLMVIAVGSGAYAAAFFHLFTHAFFKAMLFLIAGAIITYAHHEQNIRRMGGLIRSRPVLGILFWLALASLAGLPGFSGFFSKDHILAAAFSLKSGGSIIGMMTLGVSLITAFYTFRLGIIVFHGSSQKDDGHSEHEALPSVSFYLPLILLAVPAVFAGLVGIPAIFTGSEPVFFEYIVRNFPVALNEFVRSIQNPLDHAFEIKLIAAGIAAAVTGSTAAIIYYGIMRRRPAAEGAFRSAVARLSLNRLYIDEIYQFVFVTPYKTLAQTASQWEIKVLPALSEGVGLFTQAIGAVVARLQTGDLAHYAMAGFAGILVLLAFAMGVL
jgi:NADH-quinone oxidoreductase subunit L